MPGRGRKAKPVSVKETQGTLRKDRLPANMPLPSKRGMAPPATLAADERKCFALLHGIVAGMGNDSATFCPALVQTACIMARVNRLRAITAGRYGPQMKINRYAALLQRDEAALRHWLSKFGLTPTAIQRTGSITQNPKDNSCSRFGAHG
jgi:hypothetical protein